MRPATFVLAMVTLGCTSKPPTETVPATETPGTDSGTDVTDADADADADGGSDSGITPPREPLETDCSSTEGAANVSGQIEGGPARMVSAAWYADGSDGGAWIVLSPSTSACSLIEDFKSNTHELRAISIKISDFSASHLAPVSVIAEPEITAGDGRPEAIVNGWEPLLNLAIIMEHGLLSVHSATLGDTIQVTGLDTWSEFGDAVSGDFTACWCPAAADFLWPIIEDSSPPAPPPVSD
jgi:hypothetical protein